MTRFKTSYLSFLNKVQTFFILPLAFASLSILSSVTKTVQILSNALRLHENMNSGSQPILFYDIASAPPVSTYAPNPWKTRYALNFKGVEYETQWVDLPDVAATRKKLGCPPNRTLPNGEPFHTLPVIHDTAKDKIVGDTFEIACYLDETYPDPTRTLIPPGSAATFADFNKLVDKIFTDRTILCMEGFPFNPATAHISKAEFARRAGRSSWEEMRFTDPEARAGTLESLRKGLDDLAVRFESEAPDGPFLDGKQVTYADIIVGAWLQWYKAACPEFEQILSWHGGIWRRLLEGLEPYAKIK